MTEIHPGISELSLLNLALTMVCSFFNVELKIPGRELTTDIPAGKCLTAASNNDGAFVTIQTCTGADAQMWTFGEGSVTVFGSKCLDVTDGNTADGTKLQIWTCSTDNNPNQQFYYTGDYHLAWTNHGKCMDLTGGSQSDGNRVSIICMLNINFRWG